MYRPNFATKQENNAPDNSGWSASEYNKSASFVYSAAFTAPVLELLNAQPGERILDVGCGSGELTLLLQKIVEQKGGGMVVGTDFSESMLEKAKSNGVKYTFFADAQDLEMPKDTQEIQGGFDAVFSNAALHWCKRDPPGVLTSIKGVLKPGGRFIAEMGGFMNCIGVRSALYEVVRLKGHNPEDYDPWYFPSVEDYAKLLTTAGFEATHLSLSPRITPLATGLYDWLCLFARNSFLSKFTDEEASEIMREVEDKCRRDCQDSHGNWAMMYTRLRISAVLKTE
ncbi:S-adenosyl-L-methionine-dependent methyltransferase [Phlegmacium glaucopus]|nr:S-adenosyl-L-methionine-dependent methyltransferase [Phlegmacium glaucopus]